MTKRVHIQGAHDYDESIIGIASDEKVWKLCFEINNLLEINLLEKGLSSEDDPRTQEIEKAEEDSLFTRKSLSPIKRPLRNYEDTNSDRGREFALFAIKSADLPATIRAFRYFLLIRAIDPPPPDLVSIVSKLNSSALIRSAVDLSNVKNIKSLIP
ncbi:MAG: hypothetical protein AAFQ68_12615 [Bacteroidota bacterium]